MYGLFAPIHKVSKAGGPGSIISPLSAGGMVTPSPRRGSVPKYGLGMSLSRERSGSQDSISSIGSSASSVSRSRVRLGVTSLSNQVHAAWLLHNFDLVIFLEGRFLSLSKHCLRTFIHMEMYFFL